MPLPPELLSPHALMVPAESSAANAEPLDAMETKPLPAGALLPPYEECPHALMAPEESSAAKAESVDAMETKPLPVGPTPPSECHPHALIVPEEWSAAKPCSVDAMETKPLPVGALLQLLLLLQSVPAHAPLSPPPELGEPHALMVPEESSAANAPEFDEEEPVDAMETKPLLPVGAPLPVPPELLLPQTLMVPAESSAANAELLDAMETKPLPVGAPSPPEE